MAAPKMQAQRRKKNRVFLELIRSNAVGKLKGICITKEFITFQLLCSTYYKIIENGHPIKELMPAARIETLWRFKNQPPYAIITMYIEKLDGKNAVDEMNIPVEATRNKSVLFETFGPKYWFTALWKI